MKTNSLLSLVSLATAAIATNVAPLADQTVAPDGSPGKACTVSAGDKDPLLNAQLVGGAFSPFMTPETFDPMSGGCDGCLLSDTIVETYCESRGTDCDGLFGFDESYEWTREKYLYQCGTPGQPGYGWFVECSTWAQEECCDDGTTGLPPTSCGYQGASACSSREPG